MSPVGRVDRIAKSVIPAKILESPEFPEDAAGQRAGTGGCLAVSRLVLSDFRSFGHLRIAVDGRPVVLTGANGAGKTNLLEAVSLLGPGRGLRNARLSEITRHGASAGWAVAATLTNPGGGLDMLGGRTEIGTGLAPPPEGGGVGRAPERRVVKVDGEPVRGTAALARLTAIAWLTPQMDRLFNEGAAPRRRFLDRLVYGFDGDHARRVNEYDKAMRERARLLAGGGASAWLAAVEETMASRGIAIVAARRDTARWLSAALAERDGPFPRASLRARGDVEDSFEGVSHQEAEAAYRAGLLGARGTDAARGMTTLGPHRSDLEVRHLGTGRSAGQSSTGEQKALLTAIVLANAGFQGAHFGATPLVLLDEVAAHLDSRHREALFEEIAALGGQAWLSGLERETFAALEGTAQFLSLSGGRVVAGEGA